MRYSAILLSSIAMLAIVSTVQAQHTTAGVSNSSDAAIQQRAAAHMHNVRGAENPTAIPYGIKLRKFFRQADRQLLTDTGRDQLKAALQLSQADWEVLTASVQRDRSAMNAIEQSDQKRVQDICQRASAGELEPTAIGRSLREAQDRNERVLTQHYKALVERLSADGQRALLTYVDTTVVRSMSYGRIDFEGLLAEFPELAADVAHKCANSSEASPPQEASGTNKGFTTGSEQ